MAGGKAIHQHGTIRPRGYRRACNELAHALAACKALEPANRPAWAFLQTLPAACGSPQIIIHMQSSQRTMSGAAAASFLLRLHQVHWLAPSLLLLLRQLLLPAAVAALAAAAAAVVVAVGEPAASTCCCSCTCSCSPSCFIPGAAAVALVLSKVVAEQQALPGHPFERQLFCHCGGYLTTQPC